MRVFVKRCGSKTLNKAIELMIQWVEMRLLERVRYWKWGKGTGKGTGKEEEGSTYMHG